MALEGIEKSPSRKVIDAIFENPKGPTGLCHVLSFTEVGQSFEISDERIENEAPDTGYDKPYFYYHMKNGQGILNVKGTQRQLQREEIDPTVSSFPSARTPDQYPELTYLGSACAHAIVSRMELWEKYHAAVAAKSRSSQCTSWLDASNLGLVPNRLRREPLVKKRLLEALRVLYEGIDDFDVQIEGGTVQVFFHEGLMSTATRLSDGTLRYLCLLSILLHPNPPPLVCIEESELGLHPDVILTIAELLSGIRALPINHYDAF